MGVSSFKRHLAQVASSVRSNSILYMQLDAMGPLSPRELAALEAAQAETLDFIAHADIGRKPPRRDAPTCDIARVLSQN